MNAIGTGRRQRPAGYQRRIRRTPARGRIVLPPIDGVEESSPPDVSIVVPVYNSERTLTELVERILRVMRAEYRSVEILLVNDGSADGSWEVICGLASTFEPVRGIDLLRNSGQHNALLCGVREAAGAIVVTLDDDLQHPPEEIPKLLDKLDDGADVVYGFPIEEQHGFLRDLGSRLVKVALLSAMGVRRARNASAFRAFRTELRHSFASYDNTFVSLDVLLSWATTRFSSVASRHEPRLVGVSNYSFLKLLTHAVNMITGYSVAPLRVASFVGFGFTAFGALVLLYVVGRYVIDGGSVSGFPFLASIIAIFSGAQMFALGIIGEYLARMYSAVSRRPAYTVRREVGGGSRRAHTERRAA